MSRTRRFAFAAALAWGAAAPLCAQGGRAASPPAMAAIREAELRADLFALAGDAMRGREAGTPDELRAAAWVAERARAAGLEPAGDDGTYFQFFSMRRVVVSERSRVALGGEPLALWRDVSVFAPADASVDAPVVFVGEGREQDVAGVELRGKAVAAVLTPPRDAPPRGMSLWARRYTRAALRERAAFLARQGAAAVILVSDSVAEGDFDAYASSLARGTYALDSVGVSQRRTAQVPVLWVRRAALDRLRAPGQRLTATLASESFVYPSVNVVARVRGSDPALRGEYVVFSGHHDHDGVRFPVSGDSIFNGADDNATVSVALLAIGRAFARNPGPRSALFVWHGAEERGLLGSRWYVDHPTVPKGSLVAVLNGDMIGRNAPDSAALLGSTPPHRNSAALVRMARDANARTARFAIDTTWDAPTHPEFWYFRSDHLPYAQAGIPAIFFTTLLHPDYHTPRDEPQRIDVAKLARMTRWMYATGWAVAATPGRPGVDPGFRLER
ncbi:MAG: M28 family peptidase [Gemmatimonadetes bacterium]|nr:M28 family peptidase [Gemmatimonadota bacterium]